MQLCKSVIKNSPMVHLLCFFYSLIIIPPTFLFVPTLKRKKAPDN
nr:MAG TPA: hypothetical protein [Caudoviricetes sp.]DAV32166.1 MAG TPA: hypothetical protein [Caudoviricetes sp.]